MNDVSLGTARWSWNRTLSLDGFIAGPGDA